MVEDYYGLVKHLLKRCLIALPVFVFGGIVIAYALGRSSAFAALGPTLIGVCCLIVGSCIIAEPIARIIAEPSGGIYYSRNQAKELSHTALCNARIQVHRKYYKSAKAAYESMISTCPRDVRPYKDLIVMYLDKLNDRQEALQVYEKSLKHLNKKDRESLFLMFK
ncbi:hypothetical protein [Rubellicoccus peritrichatus]|uniref:Tetratricopeptide repeat protein n=1 Tax=Rubellicoccus peritrichatus TaxID=3080537 RepID=A0AAQ3QRE0_9BACT|nr:hypothetical protein [Puniceicoccus sp. CR14]WOO41228.1 hypothetical protein RZN69_21615 [Puniceicoccus sp. CR14]